MSQDIKAMPLGPHNAKTEILRMDKFLEKDVLLIGGLAVNQYHNGRDSEDIDIVCNLEDFHKVKSAAYPTAEYVTKDSQSDIRPSLLIKNFATNVTIKIGPKIIERAPYNLMNYGILYDGSKPFTYDGIITKHIKVPPAHALAYTKIISFLARRHEEKGPQDLKDFCDLTNNVEFVPQLFWSITQQMEATQTLRSELSNVSEYEREIFKTSILHRLGEVMPPFGNPDAANPSGDHSELSSRTSKKPSIQEYLTALKSETANLKRPFKNSPGRRFGGIIRLWLENDSQMKRRQGKRTISQLEQISDVADLHNKLLGRRALTRDEGKKILSTIFERWEYAGNNAWTPYVKEIDNFVGILLSDIFNLRETVFCQIHPDTKLIAADFVDTRRKKSKAVILGHPTNIILFNKKAFLNKNGLGNCHETLRRFVEGDVGEEDKDLFCVLIFVLDYGGLSDAPDDLLRYQNAEQLAYHLRALREINWLESGDVTPRNVVEAVRQKKASLKFWTEINKRVSIVVRGWGRLKARRPADSNLLITQESQNNGVGRVKDHHVLPVDVNAWDDKAIDHQYPRLVASVQNDNTVSFYAYEGEEDNESEELEVIKLLDPPRDGALNSSAHLLNVDFGDVSNSYELAMQMLCAASRWKLMDGIIGDSKEKEEGERMCKYLLELGFETLTPNEFCYGIPWPVTNNDEPEDS